MRAILVVLFMVLFLVQSGHAQQKTHDEQRQPADQQQPPYPPIRIEIVEDHAEADARQRREAESHQNQKDDLVAQQGMNAATQEMNLATQKMADIAAEQSDFMRKQTEYICIQTWLMGIGTILLLATLWISRKQVNDQWRIHVEQTRPFLRFDGDITAEAMNTPTVGRQFFVRFNIKNIGATPAVNTRAHVCVNRIDFGWLTIKETIKFAESRIGEKGVGPDIIPHGESKTWGVAEGKSLDVPDGPFGGLLAFICVTYQRGGDKAVYYTARQLRIEPDDARIAFRGKGLAKVGVIIVPDADTAT